MAHQIQWTLKKCLYEARRFRRSSDWLKNSKESYLAALLNDWFDDCSAHMTKRKVSRSRRHEEWTQELCHAEARKYKARTEWAKTDGSSYQVARVNGWLEQCCSHMLPKRRGRKYWTKERCLEEARKYQEKWEWFNANETSYLAARKHGWHDECCKHMRTNKSPLKQSA